ncbi:MAG: chemotaxis protein CheX [Treponema sp.]|jgi:chemotaxis protein CheX|nr:chemotaxis protein CheX [Treponema sp.]
MEQYIQPFIDVCKNVFVDFLGCELIAERPYLAESDTVNEWDVSAVIGFTGEARGAVVISMKTDLAVRLTGILTGAAHYTLDEDVIDAIGEIINIIAGNAKKGLEEAFRLVISLPTIIEGNKHSVKWPNNQARIIRIPFNIFEKDSFFLSVAIEVVKDK